MTEPKVFLTFCENVRSLRIKNQLSKKAMAQIMGIGVPTLSKLESGRMPERLEVAAAMRLVDYFGLKSMDLLFCPDGVSG